MQFVPKSDLTDHKIWSYMLAGNYGNKLQQYAQRIEKLAKNAKPTKQTSTRPIFDIGDLL